MFYSSPYPWFSPKSYHPKRVSRFTKICYTPYGPTLSKVFLPMTSGWFFFRYLYCCYCTSKTAEDFYNDRIKKAGTQKYQKIAFLGYPAMARFVKLKNEKSEVWNFSKNDFRVLWTPRWSTSDEVLGSNFLKYKDFLIDFAGKNKDIDFVFRPHPLTLGNFLQTGEMTREEVENFKAACKSQNLRLDESGEYAQTFWQSSAIVADFSSILLEYFVTGHPIIYCATKTNRDQPTKEFERILECCYIAKNKDEIEKYVLLLKNAIDPLKEKRLFAAKEIFSFDIENIPKRIADDIYEDFKKNEK